MKLRTAERLYFGFAWVMCAPVLAALLLFVFSLIADNPSTTYISPTPPSHWPGAVKITRVDGSLDGSGFVPRDGVIVTANHVVDGEGPLFANGLPCFVLSTDPENDVAILACPSITGSVRVRPALLDESARVDGYTAMYDQSVPTRTRGRIAALHEKGRIMYAGPCQSGMSGGPVFADDGCVIGIVSSAAVFNGLPNTSIALIVDGAIIDKALRAASDGSKQ